MVAPDSKGTKQLTDWTELTPPQKQQAVRTAIETDGLTYSQAARIFGTTRTAIAGVANRSKKSPEGRIVPKFQIAAPPRSNVRRKTGPKNATQIVQEKARRARAAAIAPEADEPLHAPAGSSYDRAWVALPDTSPVAIEHHHDGCRWPIEVPGAVDYLRIAPPDSGKAVYCARHHALGVRAEAPSIPRTVKGRLPAFNL